MGYRLSKIVTRTGDTGTTGLGDGTRLAKDSVRIEALGTVDELNSTLAMVLALPLPETPPARSWLIDIQNHLFDLGAQIAVPGGAQFDQARVERLEQHIAQLNDALPPLKEFVLPGGGPAAAACHFARAVCRRAERCCWALVHADPADSPAMTAAALRYLNRLSDFLFVLARTCARAEGGNEELWRHSRQHSAANATPDGNPAPDGSTPAGPGPDSSTGT